MLKNILKFGIAALIIPIALTSCSSRAANLSAHIETLKAAEQVSDSIPLDRLEEAAPSNATSDTLSDVLSDTEPIYSDDEPKYPLPANPFELAALPEDFNTTPAIIDFFYRESVRLRAMLSPDAADKLDAELEPKLQSIRQSYALTDEDGNVIAYGREMLIDVYAALAAAYSNALINE